MPFSHYQHLPESVQPHLSFRNGAIITCPFSSWKILAATLLVVRRNWGLISGLETTVGSLKVLRPAFLSSMSLFQLLVACSVALRLRKARL